ncbi:MAG: hypothetical protein AB7I52_04885 [Rhizobiaceae bacterium]
MARISIRLSRVAAEKARNREAVEKAALAAFAAAGRGDIHFAPFTANGQRFALSARSVIDVEWLPNRVPDKVLRPGERGRPKRTRP